MTADREKPSQERKTRNGKINKGRRERRKGNRKENSKWCMVEERSKDRTYREEESARKERERENRR